MLAGFAQQLPIHGDDEPNFLSNRDELNRWKYALRTLPPRQRLESP